MSNVNSFRVGDRVRVNNSLVDFRFFRKTETGVITRNTHRYLGIMVKFDEPMRYEDGYICYEHNFSREDLVLLDELDSNDRRWGNCMEIGVYEDIKG